MADKTESKVPPLTAEQRRVTAAQYERAQQVLQSGNHDYAIQLLLTCCKLDPANLIYRNALRHTQRKKHGDNQRGSRFSLLTSAGSRLRLKAAARAGEYAKALEHAEEILNRNPWDLGAQMAMADAFTELGLLDQAVWSLEQARRKDSDNLAVNRSLARLYEQRGNFKQAFVLWQLVRKAAPDDAEAHDKARELAARETIARGDYERKIHGGAGGQDADKAEAAAKADTLPQTPALRTGGSRDDTEEVAALPEATGAAAREAAPLLARIKSEPSSPHAYRDLAALYRRAGQPDEARAVLQCGLERAGNPFELAAEMADLDIEPFRHNLAVVEERVRKQPGDEALRKLRTRLLKEINTRELDLFRQKSERFPTEAGHRFEMGVRLLKAGQIDEAIRELQVARADPRFHARALVYLGYGFKARHNWRLAQRNFAEALQSLPAGESTLRKDVLFQLAQGSAEAGDLTKALEHADELANLDFSYRGIGRLIDEWQARLQGSGTGGATGDAPPAR